MINIKQLVALSNEILSRAKGGWPADISIRTVRYYTTTEKVLAEPARLGRDNMYSAEHVKQLLALKILQAEGLGLKTIKKSDRKPADILRSMGIDPFEIDRLVQALSLDLPAASPEKGKETEMSVVAGKIDPNVSESDNVIEPNEKTLKVTVTDTMPYTALRTAMRLGSAFVFVRDVPEEQAKEMYRLINGQKTGQGKIETAAIPVIDSLILPGCMVEGNAVFSPFALLVPDKDVYQEGDDIARILVFYPREASKQQTVEVIADGVQLETLSVSLDKNGCGLLRVPTQVAGKYTLKLQGHNDAVCAFDVSRYELAPFTVTSSNLSKEGNKLTVSLRAESYGVPFDGKAKGAVTDGQEDLAKIKINFVEGVASITFDVPDAAGALSLRIQPEKDATLVGSVPLTGTAKHERSDTTVSEMGQVTSVSMLGHGSKHRGLFFNNQGRTNTPVQLHSCILPGKDKSPSLTFIEDAENVTIVVHDLVSGQIKTQEHAKIVAGTTQLVTCMPVMAATIHVGAFIGGSPWEGHAFVMAPSESKIEIEAPRQAKPSQTISVKLRGEKGTSVLVKILDKRVRTMYEPAAAAASLIKRVVAKVLDGRLTGNKISLPPMPPVMSRGILRGMTGMTGWTGATGPTGGGGVYGASGHTGTPGVYGSSFTYRSKGLSIGGHSLNSSNQVDMSYHANEDALQCYFAAPGAAGAISEKLLRDDGKEVEEKTAGGINLADCMRVIASSKDPAEQLELTKQLRAGYLDALSSFGSVDSSFGKIITKEQAARAATADLLYCDLITMRENEETLTISLPDSIGQFDVRAFAVKGMDWAESQADITVDKDLYLEPLIPQVAHPEDGIKARCVAVRASESAMFSVRVDGKVVPFVEKRRGNNVFLSWDAVSGAHEVTVVDGKNTDKVMRVVEAPGEETVLSQEMKLLRAGEKFSIEDEDALSVKVMPGLESELTLAVNVCTEFGHSCCEQSAAKITAACVALMVGDDGSKNKAKELVIKGEARMRSMWIRGSGFKTYPDYDAITQEWSQAAGRRLASLGMVVDSASLPSDVASAINSMVEMGKDVVKASGKKTRSSAGPMETAFYEGSKVSVKDAKASVAELKDGWYERKTEAAFAAACLIRDGNVEPALEIANAVAKSMGGTMGGGMHGSYECLAYMHMVDELRKAGVVPGSSQKATIKVDGQKVSLKDAMQKDDIAEVEALDSVVALRVNRLQRINLMKSICTLSMAIDVKSDDESSEIKPGTALNLTVKLKDGYKVGDVLTVALPPCLSRIVGGSLSKKFQIDFAGKTSVKVRLVAHDTTEKAQRWGAVVRNMYDSKRIGCVGLMTTMVS